MAEQNKNAADADAEQEGRTVRVAAAFFNVKGREAPLMVRYGGSPPANLADGEMERHVQLGTFAAHTMSPQAAKAEAQAAGEWLPTTVPAMTGVVTDPRQDGPGVAAMADNDPEIPRSRTQRVSTTEATPAVSRRARTV